MSLAPHFTTMKWGAFKEKEIMTKQEVPSLRCEERRHTVGEKVLESYNKPTDENKVIDLSMYQMEKLEAGFEECYKLAKKHSPDKRFYMVMWVKREMLFGDKVLRPYFISRRSCPTPQYDQTVFKCDPGSHPEFLWTLPDKETYNFYLINRHVIPPDRWNLLKFVLEDEKGELLNKAQVLNNELS